MYTGTMISDLMATVARVQTRAQLQVEQQRIDEELREIFSMQIPIDKNDRLFMGAA